MQILKLVCTYVVPDFGFFVFILFCMVELKNTVESASTIAMSRY